MEPIHSHDVRAPSIPQKRFHARSEKYYSFRGVHPGQLYEPHYSLTQTHDPHCSLDPEITLLHPCLHLPQSTEVNTAPIQAMQPRQFFEEAQRWPRPPRYHHRHTDKLDKRGATLAYEKRRERKRQTRMVLRKGEEWEGDDEGRRHWGEARPCGICDAEEELASELEERYEDEAMWEEAEIEYQLKQRQLWHGLQTVAVWDTMEELDNDGWSVVGDMDEISDIESSSEWELVET